jgi:enoyl-CoA hydratase/carnithine racemase
MNGDERSVLYSVKDAIATLTLNRPDRMNAWTLEMEALYFDLLEQADDDPDVRVIIVTGAGRGFCPGMDSSALSDRAAGGPPISERSRPLTFPLSIRKMTVAAINGACAGIGLIQALCCDVRFVASEAKIATAFTRRGLAPEFGAGWLLTRVVGAGHASDLLLSSRTIRGVDAQRIGLAVQAVPGEELLATAHDYAADVATNCSPRAIAYAKADMLRDWTRTKEQAEDDSLQVTEREGHKEDFREGVQSFVEKRPASFRNLPPVWQSASAP